MICLLLALGASGALAREAPPAAANPELEKRVLSLSEELRCLVCQNQTLADSHAELAIDLKNQVREKLAAGMSDKQVVDYMVERYGDFVLYRPPVKATTWLLWFGPFLLLVGGIAVLAVKLMKRRNAAEDLPEEDLQRAAALLDAANDTKDKA
ncbi:cytochrome c-type biogenesis protein CcmH [Noviherbaspirillum sp. UKPF54]|nr:cytochrome c-type biogenesis protein [Noviherbaspirillum sp. UKPF54]QDZ30492.1 cytochrome c-type biogenesis protein CcmH [Noviherbaspirillum sp. UKPF54]